MGEPATPPRWLRIFATDVRPGDLIRFAELGDAVRVVDRDYSPVFDPIFRVKIDGDDTKGVFKSSKIWIFDPDGEIAKRVMEIPA